MTKRLPTCVATGCWASSLSAPGGVALCPAHLTAVTIAIAQQGDPRVEKTLFADVPSIVYYVTFDGGKTVKIGTTKTPKKRLAALASREKQPGELLAARPGHFGDEALLHQRFERLCTGGRTGRSREWFRMDHELHGHIDAVRQRWPMWQQMVDVLDRR